MLAQDSSSSYHRQGSLDGLCGVYCIINALSLMLGENSPDPEEVFAALLGSLRGQLPTIVVSGMHSKGLETLLRCTRSLLAKRGLCFRFRRACDREPASLSRFWETLAEHHAQQGDGAILLGMTGEHDHWTCVESISHEALHLADSGVLTSLRRNQVSIKRASTRRNFVLQPTQAFLLSVDGAPPSGKLLVS